MKAATGRSIVGAWIAGVAATVCVLSGCSHYKVTDPTSGKVYYTESIDHTRHQGYIEFKDAQTKGEVTLQSSNVEKISKDEFDAAVGKK